MLYCCELNIYYHYTKTFLIYTYRNIIKSIKLTMELPHNNFIMRYNDYSWCDDDMWIYLVYKNKVQRFLKNAIKMTASGLPITEQHQYDSKCNIIGN